MVKSRNRDRTESLQGLIEAEDVVQQTLIEAFRSVGRFGPQPDGSYAAVAQGGIQNDGRTSIVYNPTTGELAVDAPAGTDLTSINVDSAVGIFTGDAARNLGGSFDNDADNNIFKATFGSSFGSLSFGNVAQTGLTEDFMLGDLTVIGSLAGGGHLGDVDLVYVPEPASALLLAVGVVIGLVRCRRFGS